GKHAGKMNVAQMAAGLTVSTRAASTTQSVQSSRELLLCTMRRSAPTQSPRHSTQTASAPVTARPSQQEEFRTFLNAHVLGRVRLHRIEIARFPGRSLSCECAWPSHVVARVEHEL